MNVKPSQCRKRGLLWPHTKGPCPNKGQISHICSKPNHFVKMCFSCQNSRFQQAHKVNNMKARMSHDPKATSDLHRTSHIVAVTMSIYLYTLGLNPGKQKPMSKSRCVDQNDYWYRCIYRYTGWSSIYNKYSVCTNRTTERFYSNICIWFTISIDSTKPKLNQKARTSHLQSMYYKVCMGRSWAIPLSLNFSCDILDELEKLAQQRIIEKFDRPTPWVVILKKMEVSIWERQTEHPTVSQWSNNLLKAWFSLAQEGRHITMFATHKGLRRYTRLNFGTNSASELFQHIINEQIRDSHD